MKKKIISLIMIGIVSLGLIGCGEEDDKTITGKVLETSVNGSGRYTSYYILVETESGNVKFNCNQSLYNSVTKDLKVKIKYDSNLYADSIEINN